MKRIDVKSYDKAFRDEAVFGLPGHKSLKRLEENYCLSADIIMQNTLQSRLPLSDVSLLNERLFFEVKRIL